MAARASAGEAFFSRDWEKQRVAVAHWVGGWGGGARLFASLADDFLFPNVGYRYLHGNAEADGKFSTNCWTTPASRSFFRRFYSVHLWGLIFFYIQNRTPCPDLTLRTSKGNEAKRPCTARFDEMTVALQRSIRRQRFTLGSSD